RREHHGHHPCRVRVLRAGLRHAVPVRQVRPALRPGVQRRCDGERRLHHPGGEVRVPLQGAAGHCGAPYGHDPARAGTHVVRGPGDHAVWNDLWLNESFAEFASTLATAEATEWTGAWTTFASLEKGWAYRQDQLPSTHPIVAEIADLEDVEVNFDGITYAKGASVLKQLVAWVGQEQFLAGVRAYFRKHAWGNTELSDLLTELEA